MQAAGRGLIKNLTIAWQENRIKNMAASVNPVPACGNSSVTRSGSARFAACVCAGVPVSHACTRMRAALPSQYTR